ncbi:hypothetical protein GUJ93_ZPchr0007g5659 [Zizania palustris]|uniref:Uncharacterized protein n=1 Tax=Zizania palustris TaxID=103762 RepID=A0A8J5W616_ZIZPA|nr:hypothetical protein GUJ93_ZPchr0007g5659 [Zizania palustris]
MAPTTFRNPCLLPLASDDLTGPRGDARLPLAAVMALPASGSGLFRFLSPVSACRPPTSLPPPHGASPPAAPPSTSSSHLTGLRKHSSRNLNQRHESAEHMEGCNF